MKKSTKTIIPTGIKKSAMELAAIATRLKFKDWNFAVHEKENGEIYLQLHWTEPCADTGKPLPQTSRKWKLSPWMTKSEVVQTAFKAVLTALEHEAREVFLYRDAAIFGPHFDVDDLVDRMPKKDARKAA